jgi:hypothetical protein
MLDRLSRDVLYEGASPCVGSQNAEHGMAAMYEASRKEQAEQYSSDKTYRRTKCEVLVRLLLSLQELPKLHQAVKGNSGDGCHDHDFITMLHGDLYSSQRNGFAIHHTCERQYSWSIRYVSYSGGGENELTIHIAATDQDVSVASHLRRLDLPKDEWHASRCKNPNTVSDL